MTLERPVEPAPSVSPAGNPDRKAALGDALRRRILTMQIAPGAVLDEVSAERGVRPVASAGAGADAADGG